MKILEQKSLTFKIKNAIHVKGRTYVQNIKNIIIKQETLE